MSSTGSNQPIDKNFSRTGSLGYQVNHLARLLEQFLRTRIAHLGVVPGQFTQLLALYEEDGLTQSELTQRIRIDQSTLAHTLKRMERDGLVRREQDDSDRRRVRVHLTPHALELKPELQQAASELNRLALEGLSSTEEAEFLKVLQSVIGKLESEIETEGGRS